jgi:FMN reductase
MGPLKVVTVNGSVNRVSKTGALLDLALETLTEKASEAFLDVEPVQIELRTLRLDLAQAMSEVDLLEPVQHAIATMTGADLVIVGTPIYKASYSGLFKQFFDVVDQYALANKPVLLTATGGSDRHALAIDTALRPLFAYFQAHVAPVGIYASGGDFAGYDILNPEVFARTEMAMDDILPWLQVAERV